MGTAGEKVTIAVKVETAWLEFQVNVEAEVYENTQTGVRKIKVWNKTGPLLRLRGTAYPRGTPPEGFPPKPDMVGGFALNHGIDKEVWDKIAEQYADNVYIKGGLIFAYAKLDHVRGTAKERHELMSGLEPMKVSRSGPEQDPRLPRPTHHGVSGIETEETRAAKVAAAQQA